MLNQIILQLHVSFPITHVFMKLNELLKCCRYSMLKHNILTLKLKALIVRIVGVANEIVEKELVGGVHFVPCQTVEQLAGVDEGDGWRRESHRPRTS